jgi:hypothetical protein
MSEPSPIKDSVVKIVDNKGDFHGSGFFLYKDYCVTSHVNIAELDDIFVEKYAKRYRVEWISKYSDMTINLAVLRLLENQNHLNREL